MGPGRRCSPKLGRHGGSRWWTFRSPSSRSRLRIPRTFNPKAATSRRDLAAALRAKVPFQGGRRPRPPPLAAGDDDELLEMRRRLRAHPCHGCADREEHARWAERWLRLRRETEQLQRRVETRTNTIARQFDRVCAVLETMGYLRGDEVTSAGRRLARLYTELDLLAAEALREGLWDDLEAAELAACLSALSYESRQPDDAVLRRCHPAVYRMFSARWFGSGAISTTWRRSTTWISCASPIWAAHAAWRWARGDRLESVLTEADLTAGDFVRAMRQLLDLLDQVADAAGDTPLRQTARQAAQALRRGVVDYATLSYSSARRITHNPGLS